MLAAKPEPPHVEPDDSRYPAATWFAQIIFSLGRFTEAHAFLTDTDAIAAHVSEVTSTSGGRAKTRTIKKGPVVEFFRATRRQSFAETADFLSRQQIIYQVTLTEVFACEFFRRAFEANPARIAPYFTQGERQPVVSLKKVIAAKSRETLLAELISEAAGRASDAAPQILIRRIATATGRPQVATGAIALKLAQPYGTLVALRNELVHEHPRKPVTVSQVIEGFEITETFLRYCEEAAILADIPVDPVPDFT